MTVKMKLYVATGNAHKLKEISQILPGFEIVAENPGDVEENAPDFAGNALIKVRAIAGSRRGEWCMADDSGLEVEALGGEPGVRSARYAGGHGNTAANNELLSCSDLPDCRWLRRNPSTSCGISVSFSCLP